MQEVTTLFDSDRAEYEYMQEQVADQKEQPMKEQIEKQAIEEMARKMCRNYMPNGNCAADDDPCGLECVFGYCAERIYCAGYSRQAWISVDERLPQKHDEVLVFCDGARQLDFICSSGRWYDHDHKKVTHWMPLPEPPKMKGGVK
jgi:hypothetical protein